MTKEVHTVMKKMMLVIVMFLVTIMNGYSQTTVRCNTCNGYKVLRCGRCNGAGVVCGQVYNPYYGCYQIVQQYCSNCGGRGVVICNRCGGYGYLVVNYGYQPSFRGKHCTETVGCGCPGFDPITNAEVWKLSYCRHCGHKKKNHK